MSQSEETRKSKASEIKRNEIESILLSAKVLRKEKKLTCTKADSNDALEIAEIDN